MNIKEFISGIIVGIAKIIPGLSGAVVMISFNLYDKAIRAITNFFDDVYKNFIFLFNLGVGVIVGIVMFSKVVSFFINNYYVYTVSLFVGLIMGGIPIIFRKVNKCKSNYLILILSFIIITLLSFFGIDNNYIIKNNFTDIIIFFIAGILEAVGSVLPGISSTALLMIVGVYDIYISSISNIFNISNFYSSLRFLIPFSFGLLFGIIFITLIINYLFKHFYQYTFSFIIGVSLSSLFLLLIKVLININNVYCFMFCLIIMYVGYFVMRRI